MAFAPRSAQSGHRSRSASRTHQHVAADSQHREHSRDGGAHSSRAPPVALSAFPGHSDHVVGVPRPRRPRVAAPRCLRRSHALRAAGLTALITHPFVMSRWLAALGRLNCAATTLAAPAFRPHWSRRRENGAGSVPELAGWNSGTTSAAQRRGWGPRAAAGGPGRRRLRHRPRRALAVGHPHHHPADPRMKQDRRNGPAFFARASGQLVVQRDVAGREVLHRELLGPLLA
jgi:hypothetical protein